jgi:hypothetical protein
VVGEWVLSWLEWAVMAEEQLSPCLNLVAEEEHGGVEGGGGQPGVVGQWNFTRYRGGKNTKDAKKAKVLISVSCGGIFLSSAFAFPAACFYRGRR